MKSEPINPAAVSMVSKAKETNNDDFDDKSKAYFSTLLSRYKYGKNLDLLLDPATNFKVIYHNGDEPFLELQNYDCSGSYKGVCGELAHSFGVQALTDPDIRTKFDILVVVGSVKDLFPSGHAFLLAAPKDLNIRSALSKNRDIFPEGSMVIDPSLGTFEDASAFNKDNGKYKLNGLVPYEEVQNSSSGNWQLGLSPNTINPIVLGFLKDYVPLEDEQSDNKMLYLAFHADAKSKISDVSLTTHNPQTNETEAVNLDNFSNTSGQVRHLRKLLEKVRDDLKIIE